MPNLGLIFIGWWYKEGYIKIIAYFKQLLIFINDQFSVSICLKTLFDVWRRDYKSTDNLSLQEKFQVLIENMASRVIGLIIKSLTLVIYCIVTVIVSAGYIIFMLIWLFYPVISLLIFIIGIAFLLGVV